jgi:glycosyltransferase involved in cell wall biosynthesis
VRILKVTQAYYPFQEQGGPVVKVRALGRGLARRGHQVTVLTPDLGLRRHDGHGAHFERCDWGMRYLEDGVDAIYLPVVAHYRALTVNPSVVAFCWASLRKFDLVHFFGLYDLLGPSVSFFCRRQGVPYLIEPMGMCRPIDRSFRLKALWHQSVGRPFLRNAERIVATSELEQQELVEDGIPPGKIVVRYNGVDPPPYSSLSAHGAFRSKWGIPPDEALVLFLSRLIPRKGADILIESFARVCPNFGRLVIAGPEGEPGYRRYLEQWAAKSGVATRVLFVGPLYDEQKWAAMADSDVFVLNSRYENFANAAAEAIACGVPVIVTDRCGIASLVQGQAGLVIKPEKDALIEALYKMIHEKELYGRLKDGCEHVARQLSWDLLTEQMEGYYADVSAKR